ncbi:type IV pilus biogenesis protein PilP, partial [Shigella sonnei]
PMTSLKTSIKTITYLSDTGCLEIQGASLPTSKNRKELPVIMEINGKDKRLNAVLRMADGRQTSVTTGSQLPGTSVTVKSISLSGVTLSDGTTLTF